MKSAWSWFFCFSITTLCLHILTVYLYLWYPFESGARLDLYKTLVSGIALSSLFTALTFLYTYVTTVKASRTQIISSFGDIAKLLSALNSAVLALLSEMQMIDARLGIGSSTSDNDRRHRYMKLKDHDLSYARECFLRIEPLLSEIWSNVSKNENTFLQSKFFPRTHFILNHLLGFSRTIVDSLYPTLDYSSGDKQYPVALQALTFSRVSEILESMLAHKISKTFYGADVEHRLNLTIYFNYFLSFAIRDDPKLKSTETLREQVIRGVKVSSTLWSPDYQETYSVSDFEKTSAWFKDSGYDIKPRYK